MEPTYRVVFRGELLPGFELDTVKQTAEQRLKAPPAMLAQLFSGRRVILKKGISFEVGNRYRSELENLGMRTHIETEAETVPSTEVPATKNNAAPGLESTGVPPLPPEGPLSQDLGAYAPPTEAVVFSSRSQTMGNVSASPRTDMQEAIADEPELTVFVPRKAGSEPTMLVEPGLSARRAPPAEPTIFVPRSEEPAGSPSTNNLPPADATVFVPRSSVPETKRSFDAERTLIASAETLAEYFSASSPQRGTPDDPSLLEDSGSIVSKPASEPQRNMLRGSADATVLAAEPEPYRPGSNETTVFVAPRRGSCDPTIMVPPEGMEGVRRSLAEEYDDDEAVSAETPKRSRSLFLIVVVVLAALGAAGYYYFAQH